MVCVSLELGVFGLLLCEVSHASGSFSHFSRASMMCFGTKFEKLGHIVSCTIDNI